MKKLYFLVLLLLPLWGINQAKIIPGQLILQLEHNITPDIFLKDVYGNAKKESGLKIEKQLSTNLNVWLVELNGMDDDQVLDLFLANDLAVFVQKNHKIEKRVIPNDTEYNKSWHHNNTGTNPPANLNATAGSDIDAERAWDWTTGGTTVKGDDIVVCVIDDGIDETHPDLADNIWVNSGEVAGNGIDDDNNGYIDDIHGWNTYGSNGNMTDPNTGNLGSHGTRVSGIVGAKGNNGIGVTGVNWNVKLMTVVGGGNQAEAIEAYDYPLTMRKLYNETNGAKGAYVVSTNASWGTDFGKPDQAPIWCAMYDSLGKAGIINIAATSNSNINVDEVGDLPTTCPSLYLIGVTNTLPDDEIAGTGYGVQHIDMGAPGENIWSTTFGGGYGTDDGTSFSSPMVAGAVGLIYSYACKEFIEQSISDPQLTADMVRYTLLAGVDLVPALNGKVSTGGRLNMFRTLEEVMKKCWVLTSVDDNEIEKVASFNVVPNPSRGRFQIELNTTGDYSFSIIDISGKEVQNGNFYGNSTQINTSVAKGIYVIRLINHESGNVEVSKLIIE